MPHPLNVVDIVDVVFAFLGPKDLAKAYLVNTCCYSLAYCPFHWLHLALPPCLDDAVRKVQNTANWKVAFEGEFYSILPVPANNETALSAIIASMALRKDRFTLTQTLQLANYQMTDELLQALLPLLPALQSLAIDGPHVTVSGLEAIATHCPHLHTLVLTRCSQIDPNHLECLQPLAELEKILIIEARQRRHEDPTQTFLPAFLSVCETCDACVPMDHNTASCLYHPGEYQGYGSSCSAYTCCGSMAHGWPGTPGCARRLHTLMQNFGTEEFPWKTNIIPMELLDVPYSPDLPLTQNFRNYDRRLRHGRYKSTM